MFKRLEQAVEIFSDGTSIIQTVRLLCFLAFWKVDYVAWVCDQDAYACSGQKCSAQSILFMHEVSFSDNCSHIMGRLYTWRCTYSSTLNRNENPHHLLQTCF